MKETSNKETSMKENPNKEISNKETILYKKSKYIPFILAVLFASCLLFGCSSEVAPKTGPTDAPAVNAEDGPEAGTESAPESGSEARPDNSTENIADGNIEGNTEGNAGGSEKLTGNDSLQVISPEQMHAEKVAAAAEAFFEASGQWYSEQERVKFQTPDVTGVQEHSYILLDVPVLAFCPETGVAKLDKKINEAFLKLESSVGTAIRNAGVAAVVAGVSENVTTGASAHLGTFAEASEQPETATGASAHPETAAEDQSSLRLDGTEGIVILYQLYNKGIYTSFAPQIVVFGFSEEISEAVISEICKATKGNLEFRPVLSSEPEIDTGEMVRQNSEGATSGRVNFTALTYSSEKEDFITARDLFFEPSFIVLKKDRLDSDENATSVLGGMEDGYDVNLFEQFCFTENGLVFETEGLAPFTASYEYLLPYLKVTYDGEDNDYPIRTDLDPDKPMVALTFDDGPGSGTRRIAKIIAEYGGRCTFFAIAKQTESESSRETMQYVLDCGHEYASHSYEHKNITRLTPEEYWNDMYKAVTDIAAATGKCPTLMRLPGGNINDFIQNNNPFTLCYWGMGTADWSYRTLLDTREEVVQAIWKVVDDFLPSSGKACLLMHDLYSETASAVEYMVPILAKRGYQFVTVSELLYYKGLEKGPGHYYNATALK